MPETRIEREEERERERNENLQRSEEKDERNIKRENYREIGTFKQKMDKKRSD